MGKQDILYPSWAPEELCAYHRECLKADPVYREIETFRILCRMSFDEQMALVWNELKMLADQKGVHDYAWMCTWRRQIPVAHSVPNV